MTDEERILIEWERLLGATDSPEEIAEKLDLDPEEVREVIDDES